ncbi:Down syndrome cell adhesion molecule-like [Pollicipes pollicipes]|uniref:Down syndrome cell adhesion molecule-like n=1 Tax=Pollicipes pollicipes TaxID=41117 RepID=UPI001884ED9B|nr:Down syndrome cell adhesion molecule-like [Pollicipes pollicipes]
MRAIRLLVMAAVSALTRATAEQAWIRHTFESPFFDTTTPRNVTALQGKTAHLHCKVKRLNNKTVSWIRSRDLHILTTGTDTYTNDARFHVARDAARNDWTLMIKFAQKADTGLYECQISTQPLISYPVYLKVVVPEASILGPPDMFVDHGSVLNLTCVVTNSPQPPEFIFWYHEEQVIRYDSARGGISVVTEQGEVTTSHLLVRRAGPADSGVYTCEPSNARPATSRVHVLNEQAWIRHTFESPFFDTTTPRNVTALQGKTAHLHCKVKRLNNKTVSWIRSRDLHILTTGTDTYTNDARFHVARDAARNDWTLMIKFAQKADTGLYECQISTQPLISYSVYLKVVVPEASILGPPDMFVDHGSVLNLTCVVTNSPQPPEFIFWYHEEQVIRYDSARGGISVVTEQGEVTTSHLLVRRAGPADSGVYTCEPSNARPATSRVHVLNGEKPAAMHTSRAGGGLAARAAVTWALAAVVTLRQLST